MCTKAWQLAFSVIVVSTCGCLVEVPTKSQSDEKSSGGPAPQTHAAKPALPSQQERVANSAQAPLELDNTPPASQQPLVPSSQLVPNLSGSATLPKPNNPPPGPAGTAVPAGVGVGAQGRSLDNESGVLVTPAKSLFAVKERMVFNVQIPQAIQLFEATEGRKPQSHDEYMKRIIEANNIRLPRLEPGDYYRYDPQTTELFVHKKRR